MRKLRSRLSLIISLSFLGLALPSQSGLANDAGSQPVAAPRPGQATWAHIDIEGTYPEGPQLAGLFGAAVENLSDGLARLDKAAGDKDVAGVILRLNNPTVGWAKQNEFRQAIRRVQSKGKKVYAWMEQGGSADYLIASACDRIVMPESGSLMLLGLRAEVSFYKNLLDKLNVQAEMLRVGKYKSAAEPFTRTEMSPEFRAEMEAILDDYWTQIVDGVSEGRKLDRKQVEAAIDVGPHTAAAAKELGLIDDVVYEDELEKVVQGENTALEVKLARRYGKKKIDTDFSGFAGMVKMMNLLMGLEPQSRGSFRPKIAVIYATGAITTGRSSTGLFGGEVLGSETLIKAIRKAAGDSKVKAIVLRVDSPGGSALASDLIWRALEKVEKPVVVSMGDVAASGGYYISMGADRIFAEPGTLTGSIGVVGGKVALKGLFEKIGITTSVISRGKNSGVMSVLDGFSDSEREALTKMLHDIYGQFTRKAAEGRKMKLEDLEALAGGRVYTGRMAVENKLVDELGTLDDAIAHAAKLGGLDAKDSVERLILPHPVSPFEQLFGPVDTELQMTMTSPERQSPLAPLAALAPELAEQFKAVDVITMLSRERALALMPFRLVVK